MVGVDRGAGFDDVLENGSIVPLHEIGQIRADMPAFTANLMAAGTLRHLPEENRLAALPVSTGNLRWWGERGNDVAERLLGLKSLANDEDYAPIAGFMLNHLGHIPVPGERFPYEGWHIEVVDLDGRRIDKVLVFKLEAKPAG